jgi:predicted ATPase
MMDRVYYGFKTTALDADLLSTPYEVQTNWHVITGAPSCGKTTLIDLLASKGYRTVPEIARQYMEQELASGRTIKDVHGNGAELQRILIEIQLNVEAGLGDKDVVFLDGAVPGSLAWFRVFGLDPNAVLPECFHHRYASVFVLDRLPLKLNGFRFDEDAVIGFIDEWTLRDYAALGYQVVRVPVLPPEARLAFVLERFPDKSL